MTYDEQLKKEQEQQQNAAGSANLAAETEKNTTQESGAVQQTQNYLQQLLQNKPSGFNSQYLPQLETLYDKVMNRDKFSYDVASDPLYQQYKNQYAQMGQLAMQDAVGNAAALTGGYGNSWATTAGNQAYQGYLQQLNDKVPELYESAYNRYAQEGEDLQNQLAITSSLYDNEYSKYMDDLNYMQTMQQAAYEQALTLMQMGITPNDEILAQAGLTADDVKKYINKQNYTYTPTEQKTETEESSVPSIYKWLFPSLFGTNTSTSSSKANTSVTDEDEALRKILAGEKYGE